MAKLYVANPTNQTRDFHFNVPEVAGRKSISIPAGAQRQIPSPNVELDSVTIEQIVGYYTIYGMVREEETPHRGKMIPMVYSIDRPMKLASFQKFIDHNNFVMIAQGKESREAAAISISDMINDNNAQQGIPDRLKVFEMSIQEESNNPTYAEGIRYDLNAPPPPDAPRRPRRRAE
jgi:hypothetical protein